MNLTDVPVFPEDRQQAILELVEAQGAVSSASLAEAFTVNPATIRRDLRTLSSLSLIELVHGGARRSGGRGRLVQEVDLKTKEDTNRDDKLIIARKAVSLVSPGDTVALNSGSTVDLIAEQLQGSHDDCTFVTLSLNVARTIATHTTGTLLVAGGIYRPRSQSFTGRATTAFLSTLRADIAFLGATAVDIQAGWTHPAIEEVAPNQAMMAMASRRYLACDSSKFGVVGLAKIAELTDFSGIIADNQLPESVRSWAIEQGIEVI